jgi:PAS domain S-box-containing protein
MTESPDLLARHLARVVDSSDDAIISKDLDGIITSWNRSAERIFGYTAAEAIGRSIRMIIPTDRQAEEDEVLAKIRAGDFVRHFETVRCRKDGSHIPISLTVSPIYDDHGRVIGASKIARDISDSVRLLELTRAQAATAEKLSRVGAAVASNLDRETVVQTVTDIATDLTGAQFGAFFYNTRDQHSREGYTLYTLSGVPVEQAADTPRPGAIFAAAFHGRRAVRIDDVTADPRYAQHAPYFAMPPGHPPARSYLAVPVFGRAAEVIGGLLFGHQDPGVFTDQHEQLATGVAAWATVALENSRLYVEARDASRLKDEFLAVLSHELRTPLSAITGYARLLRGGLLTGEKAARGLEALDRSAESLARIIDDVLDVSRIISGKLRLDVQQVELGPIVTDAIETMHPAAEAKGVRIDTIADTGVSAVSGDRDRLQQVIWNLLSNAVKFTPRGGRVQVRVERVNSHIELSVSDTGIGIPAEFLPHVFERFTQRDQGTTRRFGGLGLGLAIVRHIVELHGGTVTAHSAGENQGATFTVHLPTMIVQSRWEAGTREHPAAALRAPLGGLAGLNGVRVLAVDDDEDALMLLRDVLEAAGATVATTSSPITALARVAAARPDVLLVDIGMAELDGYELMRRVRASPDEHTRRTPAAALTAFARAEDRTKALQSGFEMHLAKPVDPAELVASVIRLVRRAER